MKKSLISKTIAVAIAVITVFGAFTITASAATPTLGNVASSVTLYNNCNNNDNLTRSYVIPVKNYNRNASYYVKSSNKSIATVTGSVNSKTGVTITITAKAVGKALVTVSIKQNNKTVSTKTINVTVKTASIATPKGLSASSITKNSLNLKWQIDNTNYLTTYRLQMSTDGNNWKTLSDVRYSSVNIKGLDSGKRYYFRIQAISNLADGGTVKTTSPVLRVITKS